MTPKRIVILGSTGSIGVQTLDVVRSMPGRIEVIGLAAGRNVEELAKQAREFGAHASITDASLAPTLQGLLDDTPSEVYGGLEGLVALAAMPEADLVVGAVSGLAGLAPVMAALEAGNDVALANKEPLVAAGELVTGAAARAGAKILPVDSEISAVFQALKGEDRACIGKLTCSKSSASSSFPSTRSSSARCLPYSTSIRRASK